MTDADDMTLAALRAATPPKSQLDLLTARVAELEQRTAGMAEHQNRMLQLIEQLHEMQVATIGEVRKRMTEFVTTLQQKQQEPPS